MTDQPPAPEAPEKPKRRTGEKLPRKKLIVVRLSDDEFNDASERANRAGLTRGAFARLAMLGNPGLGFQRRPQVEKELLLRTLGTLAHLTHRADQIARSITTSDVSEIRQIGQDFMPLRDAIFAALRKRGTTES